MVFDHNYHSFNCGEVKRKNPSNCFPEKENYNRIEIPDFL